jgi:hypothetical protein
MNPRERRHGRVKLTKAQRMELKAIWAQVCRELGMSEAELARAVERAWKG